MIAVGRTLVIGDVHGCLGELDELLKTAEYRHGGDRLVFLGDLVDRGPDPLAVVHRVRELGAECVLGNHEEKHLRYAAHEARQRSDPTYRNPMRPFDPKRAAEHAALLPEDLGWIATLPRSISLGGLWTAVHAGFVPDVPVSRQPPDWVIRLRYVDVAGKPVSRERGENGEPGIRRWAEAWKGPQSVVYGHHAQALAGPRIDQPVPGVRCVGIDTGCVYGGFLTAFELPTERFVQVPSRTRLARTPEPEE